MDITLTETNRGKRSMIYDGFRYRLDGELKSGNISWRCVAKGCSARVQTDNYVNFVVQEKNLHNHDVDGRHLERHIFRTNAKRKAMDDPSVSPIKIIRGELQKMPEESLVLKDVKNVSKAVYRRRRKNQHLSQPTPDISFDEIPKDGLTGGDDRPSSEYSQNEEEAAVTASPEHFMSEATEREPTPAPVAQTPPKPESYQLRHNNHLTIVLEALARDEAFMDVTLTAQGRSLKAHKSVLSAVSPYFRGVLRENPCQHPIIIMPRDVRFEELFSIVNYIYKGEMTVAAEDLTSLLKTAEILQVSGLAPSDSSATVTNTHTDISTTGNIRSSSASSSSSSSNIPSIPKAAKTVKETIQGISAALARPKSPDGMINPSDFMDMDMTYVKEEVNSGGEDDEDTVASETSAHPPENTSHKANEVEQQQEPITFSSMYNPNQEQTSASTSSSQELDNSVKTEMEMDNTVSNVELKSPENPQPYICPHCQEQHRGVDNMATHLRLTHPTKPSFTCGCGRVFTRNLYHLAHAKVCNSTS